MKEDRAITLGDVTVRERGRGILLFLPAEEYGESCTYRQAMEIYLRQEHWRRLGEWLNEKDDVD